MLLGAALASLGACSEDDIAAVDALGDDTSYSLDAPASEPAWENAEATASATTVPRPDDGAALAVPTAPTPADLGREIVYRATISVQADDVAAASDEAVAVVRGLGGIVFSQTTRTEPEPRAEIVFKVLPDDFSTALEHLAGVGRLVDQSMSADDVTERVVDLESRISTAETSVERLRQLLEEAADLEDVAQIERQLLDRETTLEVLRGQLRTLRDQVDLATVTLTITQSPTVLPDAGILAQAWVSDDADDPCLGADHFTAEPDTTLYFCLEVENTGASALTDVAVRSRDVRLDVGAFERLQGGFDRIEPGELLVAVLTEPVEGGRMAGRAATRGLEIQLEVEAVPVDADGTLLQPVSAAAWVYVNVKDDESLPGFGDSISDGAALLRWIVGVAVVVVGVLIPFLPFIAAVVALVWWRRRRPRPGRDQTTAEPASPAPPPPAPPPPAPEYPPANPA